MNDAEQRKLIYDLGVAEGVLYDIHREAVLEGGGYKWSVSQLNEAHDSVSVAAHILEARTGDITGTYQEVINEVCQRTNKTFRFIARNQSLPATTHIIFCTDRPYKQDKHSPRAPVYWETCTGVIMRPKDMERLLNCKITITETCDWKKSLREAGL
ncbi:MAG: hypothetical protein GY841_02860 [FCB group bacterium]|nr:hypothetical protein [FCB group bacterium]